MVPAETTVVGGVRNGTGGALGSAIPREAATTGPAALLG